MRGANIFRNILLEYFASSVNPDMRLLPSTTDHNDRFNSTPRITNAIRATLTRPRQRNIWGETEYHGPRKESRHG